MNFSKKNNKIKLNYKYDGVKYKNILDEMSDLYNDMFEFLNVLN